MVKQILPKAGEAILKLFSKLGGNMNNVLGSRSNITFLGKGKSPEGFIDMDINIDAIGALGKNKILEELESSIGYLTAGKLNDVQANKLLNNMQKVDDVFNPKQVANITDLGTGTRNLDQEGLGALRAQGDYMTDEGVMASETILPMRNVDMPPPGSRGGADDIAAPVEQGFEGFARTIKELAKSDPDLAAQYKTVLTNKGATPSKRATAREFLVEALKKDEYDVGTASFGKINLNNVVSAEDVKYITEGGGGIGGDPLVLVEKYFGPRIREMIPEGASSEEITIFTKRVLENVVDAAGNKPGDPKFDAMTARILEIKTPGGPEQPFAKGGRVGFANGGAQFTSGGNISPGTDVEGNVRDDNPFTGGGDDNNNDDNKPPVKINTVVESRDIPIIDRSIPTAIGLEALLKDKGKFKAVFDAEEAIKDSDLGSGAMLSYDGSIGPVEVNAMTNLSGDKNLNLGYQTKGGTNLGLETDLDNTMLTLSRTFAKGGLAKILEV